MTTSISNAPSPSDPTIATEFTASYCAALPEMRALRPEELLPINLDVRTTVATIIGALPEIALLHERMRRMPELDHAAIFSLRRYAQATWHANSLAAGGSAPADELGAGHAADAVLDRQRAYTLCLRAYDEVRRAVSYLRWHEGDADSIAPSLWVGPGGRRSSRDPYILRR